MKYFFIMTLLFLIASCSSEKNKGKSLQPTFSYQGDFYPSSMESASFRIKTGGAMSQIKMTVYEFPDTIRTVAFADSASLTEEDTQFFFAKLDSVNLLQMVTKEQHGFDGITVANIVIQNGAQNKFSFWSPRKRSSPKEHKLVEAVLGLARKKFTTLERQGYFESLEQYFDFGLPCKITSQSPLEVRMYGGFSSDAEVELNKFVRALPSDKPILVDATNFNGMGSMFYPLFRGLLERNGKIVWVASGYGAEQFRAIGVPATRMAKNVMEGRALIQKLNTL